MLPSARYATRAAALHWQGPDGPAIGRLLPGAQVWAVTERGAHAEIELPVPSADASRAPVRAWVSRDALALAPAPRPRVPPMPGDPIVDQRLVLQAGAQPFALTSCEPGIATAEGEGFRVTQRHGRVEVSGWVAVIPEHASAVCRPPPPPVRAPPGPPPLPEGYEPSNASTIALDALRAHLSRRGRIWQLAGPTDHERCDSYQVVPDDEPEEGTRGQLTWREANGFVRMQRYVLSGARWYIDSPTGFRRLPSGITERMIVLCGGSSRTLVGGDEVRWVFSTDERASRGYDPSDVERWYADRASCEEERRARKRARAHGCGGARGE